MMTDHCSWYSTVFGQAQNNNGNPEMQFGDCNKIQNVLKFAENCLYF